MLYTIDNEPAQEHNNSGMDLNGKHVDVSCYGLSDGSHFGLPHSIFKNTIFIYQGSVYVIT